MKAVAHHLFRVGTAILALMIFVPTYSQPNTSIQTFRGIDLGSELKSTERAECPRAEGEYVFPVGDDFRQRMGDRQCWTAMNSFALKLSSALFAFYQIHNVPQLPGMLPTVGTVLLDGRIEAMESLIARTSYQIVRDAMTEKYGSFDKEERISFQNRLGATYVGRRSTWTRQGSLLRVDEILEGSELAAVSLYSRKYLDSLRASNSGARSRIKDGL